MYSSSQLDVNIAKNKIKNVTVLISKLCFYQHFVESTRAVDRRIQVGYKRA